MKNTDEKNIYDILNDIEVDLSEYEKDNFNDMEKIKIKKRFRESIGKKNYNKNYKKYISVASIAIISIGVISIIPGAGSYASKIITDLVFDIKSALRLDSSKDNYVKVINQSITKDDITIRLNEAVINNDELIVSITTKSKNEITEDIKVWRDVASKLYINGEFIDDSQSSSSIPLNKNNIDEVMFFGIDSNKYKGNVNIKLELSDINIYKESNGELLKQDTIEGPFIFEFDLDASKINKDTKEVELNEVIDLEDGAQMVLEKYVYTPLSQKIYYTKNKQAFENNVDIVLKGKDNLGNPVEFYLYSQDNVKGELVASRNDENISNLAQYAILDVYKEIFKTDGENSYIELKKIKKDIKIEFNK